MKTYPQRLADFDIAEDAHAPNYVRAIDFAKRNGYYLKDDISYNRFVCFRKEIAGGEFMIELTVFADENKRPRFDPCSKEAYFGQGILSETRYYFKSMARTGGWNPKDMDELFAMALQTEKEIIEGKY